MISLNLSVLGQGTDFLLFITDDSQIKDTLFMVRPAMYKMHTFDYITTFQQEHERQAYLFSLIK